MKTSIFSKVACVAAAAIAFTVAASGAQAQTFTAYITGYSYWDNTPPGSAAIAKPVIHRKAGGKGTYNDPITIAVGHTINAFSRSMDFPAGTRFYLPRLRRYAIVEDLCGDGPRPQNGACHIGYKGHPWLDIYVDGKREGARASDACMRKITGLQQIIMNPPSNYAVVPGPIASDCRTF
jgi:hypothetical protein